MYNLVSNLDIVGLKSNWN